MVDLFDHWLSLHVMCQSLGNLTVGRQHLVVPLYIKSGGRKLPKSVPVKTAVI